jgi:hypothetical protein
LAAPGSKSSFQVYRVPSFLIGVGRNLPGMNGVTNVPQDLLLPLMRRTANRKPLRSPSKWRPREFIGRPPPPGCSPWNQPKKNPLPEEEAVRANVPAAVSLSFRVFTAILSAQYAGRAERVTRPPISPRTRPAKSV